MDFHKLIHGDKFELILLLDKNNDLATNIRFNSITAGSMFIDYDGSYELRKILGPNKVATRYLIKMLINNEIKYTFISRTILNKISEIKLRKDKRYIVDIKINEKEIGSQYLDPYENTTILETDGSIKVEDSKDLYEFMYNRSIQKNLHKLESLPELYEKLITQKVNIRDKKLEQIITI